MTCLFTVVFPVLPLVWTNAKAPHIFDQIIFLCVLMFLGMYLENGSWVFTQIWKDTILHCFT